MQEGSWALLGKHSLRKSQVHMLRASLVQEQVLVRRCLLDHLCVQIVSCAIGLLPAVVALNEAREVGFLVCALGGKLVDGERSGNRSNGYVEAGLLI